MRVGIEQEAELGQAAAPGGADAADGHAEGGGDRGVVGPLGEGVFSFLARNAASATSYFAIPPDQVVELGTQIDL